MSKRPHGRPTTYTDARGKAVFEAMVGITTGEIMGIKAACALCDVPVGTAYEWLVKEAHPFSELHALARMLQAEIEFEETREREYECIEDSATDPRRANAHRVALESRRWRLEKMSSKYADRKGIPESEVKRLVSTLAQRMASALDQQAASLEMVLQDEELPEDVRQRLQAKLRERDAQAQLRETLMSVME